MHVSRPIGWRVSAFFGLAMIATGCGQSPAPKAEVGDVTPSKNDVRTAQTTPATGKEPGVGSGENLAKGTTKPVVATPTSLQKDRLHQEFKSAVNWEQGPEGEHRPPDKTVSDKNVAKLFDTIAGADLEGGLWREVRFRDEAGRAIKYQATVVTKLGEIQIDLLPELAPNHVRNFVALARAGYYDGLPFHRSIRRDPPEKVAAYLEAGCPKGTGEEGFGSIGYWMKPEISEESKHDVGSVGAAHLGDVNSAACKFYLSLAPAPWMDKNFTVFGKISRGLDVAEAINKRPVLDEEPFDRPKEPVVIQTIRIVTTTP